MNTSSLSHRNRIGALAVVLTSLSANTAFADSGMGDYLSDGGPVMYVILGLSLLGTVLFLERAFDLYVLRRLGASTFTDRIMREVEARRFSAALEACNLRTKHPLVQVIKAGVLRANRREKEIERAMEKEMLEALPHLNKRIGLMALLANSATLIGLLGTIFGLITAFNSVAMASAAERQTALAAGISQAMYTTAFGISVALPLLFFHHFMSKRMEAIVMEVESGASTLLVALSGKNEGA
ncbi:MAG: MotA/TolQ/ExbB proton channel family protein [Myxococcales bacterium]|nr:MotA/TolQ/ExbB proton channel family protein [Myxococcales bacterium]MDD9968385.1 MotA/TolQ/ExbB proton channel family protein [Myxococcales bacterium]